MEPYIQITLPDRTHGGFGLVIEAEEEVASQFEQFCKKFFWVDNNNVEHGAFFQGDYRDWKYFEMLRSVGKPYDIQSMKKYLQIQDLVLDAASQLSEKLNLPVIID